MASVEALMSDGILRIGLGNDGSGQTSDIHESKNLGDDLLHDLDSYLEDINDRLTISRMVSDSIIKGMVNAVSQEAAEIVAAKELEVASLKEVLYCQQCGNSDTNESTALAKHDGLQRHEHHAESLGLPNRTVKEQLERLGQCIANMKGLTGNFEESLIIKNDLDGAFNCLEAMLKDMSQYIDIITFSPESFIEKWKEDLDIRKEVETMVFCTVVQGLQDEYEKQIWVVSNVLALIERFDELSELRHELDSIQKCFVGPQVGNISPQGSIEMDHLHRKVSSNHSLPSAQLWNRSGTCEELKYSMPENLETSPLEHMNAPELYQHFKTVITEMKREHESTVQQMIEEYFALKRDLLKEKELLKERGPFVAFNKEKDSEILRKKISEVIAKLDDIVRKNEKLSEFCNHSRDTLDSLLSENCCLKDSIKRQKLEALYFSSQASDAAKKDEILGFLQRKVLDIENELTEKEDENAELKLQALVLEIFIKEKDRVSLEVMALHEKERAQSTEEQNKLRDQEVRKNTELLSLTDKVEDCDKQIGKLNTELKLSLDKLKKSDDENTNISALNQNLLASIKAKNNQHIKQMESLGHVIWGLSKSFADYELRINESIRWHNLRLENSAFQLHSLIPKINVLRRTGLLYKERLEKWCSDFQKAEAEVDLLGDEVDALLSLLEKIYVALNHYSPVLQHYPGIIEILKLVKRELSGDSVKGCLTAT